MLQAYDAKLGSQSRIAKMFHVSRKCLCDLLRLRRLTGSVAPRPHGGGRTAAYEGETLEQLRELVRQQPDATLEELREMTGVDCSVTAVHNALERLDLRFKKSRSTPASKTGPTLLSSARPGESRRRR
jgi:transposase